MSKPSMAELKMVFGFSLLFCIAILAGLLALGEVKQESSFGLESIIGGLTALAGAFANWAFGESRSSNGKDKPTIEGR